MTNHVVIVGAGQAAATLVEQLHRGKFEGTVTLIGDEPVAPYQRPPLSKDYLKGATTLERLILRPLSYYEEVGTRMVLGTHVETIDTNGKYVTTSNGERIDYSALVLATGARPRSLALDGIDADNVHFVRALDDIDRMRAVIDGVEKVAVIGGGFIGLEAAAVLRQIGKEVAVLEAAPRLMERAVSKPVSDAFLSLHRSNGVDVRVGAMVERLTTDGDRVTGIRLGGGTEVHADLIIVGIGAVPNTDTADAAGITCRAGIVVDEACRTSAPDVYAIGDCTMLTHRRYPGQMRLESVQNAIDQGRVVADRILGLDTTYEALPWFWSDQFDAKLQIAGLVPKEGAFETFSTGDAPNLLVTHFDGEGMLVAAETINRVADHMASRRMLDTHARIDRQTILDANGDMKSVMKAARR